MAETRKSIGHLSVSVRVSAPVQAVWEATTDWERQTGWMAGTRVRATANGGRGVGGGIEAWTGIGPVGFLDTMEITVWEPPHRCVVRHTGRLVKGTGAFEVAEAGGGAGEADGPDGGGGADGGGAVGGVSEASTLTWIEDVELPLGPLGRLGWLLVRPAARFGIAHSLGKLAAALSA